MGFRCIAESKFSCIFFFNFFYFFCDDYEVYLLICIGKSNFQTPQKNKKIILAETSNLMERVFKKIFSVAK